MIIRALGFVGSVPIKNNPWNNDRWAFVSHRALLTIGGTVTRSFDDI